MNNRTHRTSSTRFALGFVAAAAAGALALPATPAAAQFEEEDFELRLDGFAKTDVNVDSTNLAFSGSLGYFFTDQFEAGLRQTFTYSDVGPSNLDGGSAVFVNYHFGDDASEWQPFIGGSIGYNYGDSTADTFFAGPEGGVKYFFDEDWFLFGQVEYQFFFEDGGDADEAFDDGVFLFRLGLGVLL